MFVTRQRKAKLSNRQPGYPVDQIRRVFRQGVNAEHVAVARNDALSRAWSGLAMPLVARPDQPEDL